MGLTISTEGAGFPPRGAAGSFKLPFQEQIDFFNQKNPLPSQHYDDILKSAHDRAFIVAGATKADLLNDLHKAVGKTITDGKTIKWFCSEFDAIVKKHGWTGWTGEGTEAGVAWRTRVISQTNLATSYAAGRWTQLNDPDLLKVRPMWKYIHNDSVLHPREIHKGWNGIVLPHNHPWWTTHFCPNGWGCRCRIMAVRAKEFKGHPAPDDGTYQFTDRNGVTHTIPNGIDYGFDYAMGANTTQTLTTLVSEKLINYPPAISKALRTDLLKVAPPIPLSSAVQLPVGTWAQDVAKTVLTAIDDVHHVALLPKIPLKTEFSFDYDAMYLREESKIILSTQAAHPELSLAHEIGHLIDNEAIGEIGIHASKNHVLLTEWRDAVANSAATKALNDLRGIIDDKTLNYYLATPEQWARSYAQYIAKQSKSVILNEQLSARLNHPDLEARYSQWQNSDFEPILIAIDNLFIQLGWKNAN